MQGNPKMLSKLNEALKDELTAIHQYMVQSEMCDNWGYEKLHLAVERRARDEMKHAEALIKRILFLEGLPEVGFLNPIDLGKDVESQHRTNLQSEYSASKLYNEAVRLAEEVADNGTRELLESILKDEERHIDWLEAQIDQIDQIGIQRYLAEQIG
jgi:bacterioferritin